MLPVDVVEDGGFGRRGVEDEVLLGEDDKAEADLRSAEVGGL